MRIEKYMKPIAEEHGFTYNHKEGFDHLDTITLELSEIKCTIGFNVFENSLTLLINRKGRCILRETLTVYRDNGLKPEHQFTVFVLSLSKILNSLNDSFELIVRLHK